MHPDIFGAGAPFALAESEKADALGGWLQDLTRHHYLACGRYARILDARFPAWRSSRSIDEVPFLPVSLFKLLDLRSVSDEDVIRVLMSSGTTGQVPSRIALDAPTAARQSKALSLIMMSVLGAQRLPMIIIDSPSVVGDRRTYSARGAGVLGMSVFGRDHHYALADDMELDVDRLVAYLRRHEGQPLLVFGFTFMVWKYLVEALAERRVDMSNAVLIHSGGWKKLAEASVSNEEFRLRVREVTGIGRVHNFYGMVEQVGSVFLEGEGGWLHTPSFADVVIREPGTWRSLGPETPGLIQVVSALPTSYPGHSLLTEDLGVWAPETTAGWRGKRLKVLGRVARAELRGCSDTHAEAVT